MDVENFIGRPAQEMYAHILQNPLMCNAVVLPNMTRGAYFMKGMLAQLGPDYKLNGDSTVLYYAHDNFGHKNPPLLLFVLGSSLHLGRRIDGWMLVDMYHCGLYNFSRNYHTVLARTGTWQAIRSKDWTFDAFDWTQEL